MVRLKAKDGRDTNGRTTSGAQADSSGVLVRRLSQQAAIAELGQVALATGDIETLFGTAVTLLTEVLDVEFAEVLHGTSSGEPLVLIAGKGWHANVGAGQSPIPWDVDAQAGYTLVVGEPVIVDDFESETRFPQPDGSVTHLVKSGMSVVIRGQRCRYGVLGVHTSISRQFTAEEADFLRSIANILGSAWENHRIVGHVELQARYANALADCAQALLASHGEDRIQRALTALLKATRATYVFLERNVVDAELGFCSQTVAEAGEMGQPESRDEDIDYHYWDIVPWDRMPLSRQALERGEPFVVIPELLEGPEYEQYASDPWPVKAELNIPIFIGGEWVGLVGFGDDSVVREWDSIDLSVLKAAAGMFGAFWEREADKDELRELNRAKDEFLASVSHELRTPLTAVVGFGELLRDGAREMEEDERAELLEMVVSQGTDLTNIVNDLLVAAKADIGRLELSQVPVNLRAQCAQVLESLDHDRASAIECIGNQARAIGDPDRVRQIIRNLVSNALRYGGERVRVRVLADSATAKVLVCDDGAPIPEEDRGRIFEPYQRAHNAPGVTGSLGLGLAISRQLARLMGGDLVYRHQGGESVFELSLTDAA